MKVWELSWAAGRLEVQSLGGMLGAVDFLLPSGDTVSPLHTPHWAGDGRAADQPPVVRHLRGEWPCVPFGAAREVPGLTAEWREVVERAGAPPAPADPPHGHGANEHWALVDRSDAAITIAIEYPDEHPVRRLRRTIRPRADEPAIDIELEVEVRAPARLTVGLHPVLRLSGDARGTHLRPGAYRFGLAFPGDFEPGAYPLAPGAEFSSLATVPAAAGGTIDLSRLPLERDAEIFVQICGIDGSFELYHERENYHVRLDWDAARLPSCGLWISNRGRTQRPWDGRHVALGVEPIASPFGLGPAVATAANPISRRGIATHVEVRPDHVWSTKYSLTVYR